MELNGDFIMVDYNSKSYIKCLFPFDLSCKHENWPALKWLKQVREAKYQAFSLFRSVSHPKGINLQNRIRKESSSELST